MNILFLSKDYPPYLIGGVGVYVYEMSRLLAGMGHNVYVITKTDQAPCAYIDAGVRVFRVKPKTIPFLNGLRSKIGGFLERLEYSLAVSEKLGEVAKEYHIDVVETCEARAEAFWYYLFHSKPLLAVKLHTPETVAFKMDHTPESIDYRLNKFLEEYWIGRASLRIGLSREVVDVTSRHFSIKLKEVPLMPNPIDLKAFSPSGNKSNGSLEILYVGRLEFRKGVHTLLRAFAGLQEEFPKAQLTLIGSDCGMSSFLERKLKQFKHPEQVKWIGYLPREELVGYYQKSTICVVPSIWENYPYVCLEALACGKPVIASDVGGLRKIIKHGINGLLTPAGSSKSLREAMGLLLRDARKREQLGQAARQNIEEEYAPEVIARRTLEIYQQALKRR